MQIRKDPRDECESSGGVVTPRDGATHGVYAGAAARPVKKTFTCETCGRTVTKELASTVTRKYCSRTCANLGHRLYDGTATDLDCKKCGETKPVSDFYAHSGIRRGYQYWCKACTHEERVSRPRSHADQYTMRRWKLWALYRIREEDYDEMYQSQGGCCAICGTPQKPWEPDLGRSRTGFLLVDHNHATGKTRELLCNRCNQGIGFFKEDPEWLASAIAYLRRHAPRSVGVASRLAGAAAARVALTCSVSAVFASIRSRMVRIFSSCAARCAAVWACS